jgi:hypothetical protein
MEPQRRGSVVGGVVLVAIGLALLIERFAGPSGGALVLTGLGVGFLVAHAYTRKYGVLVPGGILTGLGAGLLAEDANVTFGEPVVIGLGAGFVVVWLVDALFTRSAPGAGWWPLIPGGILLVVGVAPAFGGVDEVMPLVVGLLLTALGAILVFRGLRRRGEGEGEDPFGRTGAR